jgi:hypothetical protein
LKKRYKNSEELDKEIEENKIKLLEDYKVDLSKIEEEKKKENIIYNKRFNKNKEIK